MWRMKVEALRSGLAWSIRISRLLNVSHDHTGFKDKKQTRSNWWPACLDNNSWCGSPYCSSTLTLQTLQTVYAQMKHIVSSTVFKPLGILTFEKILTRKHQISKRLWVSLSNSAQPQHKGIKWLRVYQYIVTGEITCKLLFAFWLAFVPLEKLSNHLFSEPSSVKLVRQTTVECSEWIFMVTVTL